MIKWTILLLVLCGTAWAQFTSQGQSTIQGQFTSPAGTTAGPIIPASLFGDHVHNPSTTWPTVPSAIIRLWGTGCQWDSIETSVGVYNWSCLHQWYSLAQQNNVNLMYTVGQLPLFYSTHNPDPGPFGLVTMARTGCPGSCVVTFTPNARMNATNGDQLTFSGVTCTDGDNLTGGPYSLVSNTNGNDYPWTLTFNEGTTNATCSGGTVTDTNQTATRCGTTPPLVAPGACYSPSAISLTGVVTGTDPMTTFVNALIADDIANDPQHRLTDLECWNEPQGPNFWNSSLAQLGQMCADMYAAVKASPESYIRVHAPPPSSGAVNIQNWIAQYAAKSGNYYQYADVLGYHTYSYGPTNAPLADDVLTIATDANISFSGCANCTGKPVWATEGGWGAPTWATTGVQGPCFLNSSGGIACKDAGNNYADKAGYVAQSYALHATAGIVDFNWFAWDQCANSGLMTNCPPASQVIGGSGLAYGYTHDWLANANFLTPCAVAANHWTCFITRSGGYQAELVWDRIDAPAAFTPSATYVQYRDLAGNIVPRASWTAVPCGGIAGQLCYQYDPLLLESGNAAFQVNNSPSTGVQGSPYFFQITTVGASGPIFCDERTLPSALPPGLSVGAPNANTCAIQGSPTTAGTFPGIIIGIEDSMGNSTSVVYSITINPSGGSGGADNLYCGVGNVPLYPSDGSYASPPSKCFYSLRSATPAPGPTVAIHTAAAFTAQLASGLTCGTTYLLDAGVTYSFGNTQTFPATGCDDGHWIWIESSGVSNAAWPPEQTRITPCFGSITSIPIGRPGTCATTAPLTAVFNFTGITGTFLDLGKNNPDHIRFVGIEFARAPNSGTNGQTVGPLATLTNTSLTAFPNKIIFDQVIMHGVEGTFPMTASGGTNPYSETTRGIGLGQSNTIGVVDSYFYNFYCTSSVGTSCDSQAIGGGFGTTSSSGWGNYKVVNNFLEGAAETLEFGGGSGPGPNPCQPTCVDDSPQSIEIRLNHMFKPLQWMPPSTSTGSGYPVVKNLLECKNCEFMWAEGNILQNVWAGFSQQAYSFLLGPKNQQSGSSGICPNCSVHDVVFRYNSVNTTCNFLQFGNGKSDPPASAYAYQGFGYSVHDNVVDNMMYANAFKCGTGGQVELQISEDINMPVTSDVLHNVSVKHNTLVVSATPIAQPSALLGLSGVATAPFQINNIDLDGNLSTIGQAGTINTTGGGLAQCAFGPTPGAAVINACYNPNTFTGNALTNSTVVWPSGQCFFTNYAAIFTNYNNGSGGDYHVPSTAPCYHFSDGGTTNPGANIDLVNSSTAGVQ